MLDIFSLFRFSLAGLRVLVAATLLVGVAYPLVVYGAATAIAPWQAHGSLVTSTGEHTTDPGEAVGSALLGQTVEDAALFHNRPSAAGDGYDPLNTYGSNLGPESPALVTAIRQRRAEITAREGVAPEEVPADAVTASGSGLDPHISPTYAALQIPRVARANGLTEDEVRGLVEAHTSGRTWGILGEPRVDVLGLNIAVLELGDDLAGS